jgi:hypothetical protein
VAGFRKYVQQSLANTSLKVGRQLRNLRDLECDATFAAAEAELALPAAKADPIVQASARGLTEPLASRLLLEYVERIDERRRSSSARNPPKDADERREAAENIELQLDIVRDRAPSNDPAEAISVAWGDATRSANVRIE